ncbi:HIT family protein [Staphylococcus agnetis]|uniref:HIT family protein n=1 Tax=Staphylococcus agnetis TaxID=985762 RepID=UPI0004E40E62|nr:HIT family protein [Staphylococcus agnetis]KFE40921.1 histidine triad (HIT) protein [Staphylococcus agnetis]NJH65097.1 HIT domain-containing protein [Staphylococcus agnetis]NJH98813.1 HIT domain-containing protein [Staphylococcus agnetis]PTH47164.1 HIT family protein [Staphylococcus agnetis]PTH72012.1 HIT family protein [Staphylococcus agnetis]
MAETIFSKIIDGEIPSFKVYENDHVYAFLDISQLSKGHTLLIPKKPSANIYETDAETMKHIGEALPIVANAIKDAFNPDGLNIVQNNGEYASQSVFHIHFHLIPRYKNDMDGFDYQWETHEDAFNDEAKTQIAQQIADKIQH